MAERSVSYSFRADISDFRAKVAAMGSAVSDLGQQLADSQESADGFFEGMQAVEDIGAKLGATAGSAFAASAFAAANFEESLSAVRAATGETAGGMEALREAALDAGQATVFSATEAAGAIENLAKAGVSTQDILGGGLDGALDLAAAGSLEVADAAEAAASAMTQFGLSGQDVPHIADLLAAGAGKAQGEVSDLAMALNQSGLVAAQTGLSIEETTGALAAFASAGLTGSDAGTSFKTMLQALTPTSKEARELIEELGISAYDTQGNFVGLTEFAASLQAGLADLSVEQQNAALKTIFGSDAVRAAAVIYEQGAAGIQQWISNVDDAGYAAEQAALRTDNLKGDIDELKGALETLLISTGDGQQGFLRSATQSATDFVNVLNGLPDEVQDAAGSLLGLTAVVGGAAFFGPKVVAGIAATRAQLALLPAVAGRAQAAMLGMVATGPGLAKTAALMGGIGFMASGAAGELHATNATMGAMAGLMLGGAWGAAVGGGIGALADFSSAAARAETSQKSFNAALESADTSRMRAELKATEADLAMIQDIVDVGGAGLGDFFSDFGKGTVLGVKDIFGDVPNSPELRDRAAALRAQINATESATIAQAEFGQSLRDMPELADKSTEEIAEMSQALVESRKAARESAQTFFGLGDSVSNAEVSLSDWIAELERNARALRDFRRNAARAAKEGLDDGLIASLEEAGAAGALRMAQLADATDDEIRRANRAWRTGERQIGLYVDAVGGVPEEIATEIRVTGIRSAVRAIDTLRELIAGNPIEQRVVVVGPDGKKTKAKVGTDTSLEGLLFGGHADGGMVAGPRFPYGDKVLSWLAPGEEVISNRYGQADQFRADRAAGRIPAYSSGGTVDWSRVDAGRRASYSGGGSMNVTAQLSRADLDYLADRLQKSRPIYGDVHVTPHNYNEFRREQDADRRRASLGGAPR